MSELYNILIKSADSTGLPIINSSQFVSLTEKYGKEEFRIILAEYVAKEKPEYPLRKFNEQKVVKSFHKLKQADYTDFIVSSDKEVIEKYDDYKFPYSKYGLGVIDGPSTFNYISETKIYILLKHRYSSDCIIIIKMVALYHLSSFSNNLFY